MTQHNWIKEIESGIDVYYCNKCNVRAYIFNYLDHGYIFVSSWFKSYYGLDDCIDPDCDLCIIDKIINS